jgi:hypothetical protein
MNLSKNVKSETKIRVPWCLQHACHSTPKTRLEQIDLRVW